MSFITIGGTTGQGLTIEIVYKVKEEDAGNVWMLFHVFYDGSEELNRSNIKMDSLLPTIKIFFTFSE